MELKNKEVLLRLTNSQKELLKEYAYQNRTTVSKLLRGYIDILKLK
tara:strand:+ start:37 stop:174 length:138 start_codon:yes stop_codon:yes gene_type:complete